MSNYQYNTPPPYPRFRAQQNNHWNDTSTRERFPAQRGPTDIGFRRHFDSSFPPPRVDGPFRPRFRSTQKNAGDTLPAYIQTGEYLPKAFDNSNTFSTGDPSQSFYHQGNASFSNNVLSQGNSTHGHFSMPPPSLPTPEGFQSSLPMHSSVPPPISNNFKNIPENHSLLGASEIHNAPPPSSLATNFVGVEAYKGQSTFIERKQESLILQETQPRERKRKEDEVWLKHWLQQRTGFRGSMTTSSSSMTISASQEKVRQMLVLMAKLQKNVALVETLKHEDTTVWEPKAKEVRQLKTELEKIYTELTDEATTSDLKCKIRDRRKKRERIKQRKRDAWEQKVEELVAREQLHKEIDKSLENKAQKIKDKKQEMELKKEADSILSEVRKKISEATKSINMIDSLDKLCKLRSDRQARQGLQVSHSDTYDKEMQSLRTLLAKQIHVYKSEDSTLRVMVETEQEETREKEREKSRRKEKEKQKVEAIQQKQLLFGTSREPQPDDPIYPFRQYYESADTSLQALINIRGEWDQYLVASHTPGASRIPDNWVIPMQPTSNVWASALVIKTNE